MKDWTSVTAEEEGAPDWEVDEVDIKTMAFGRRANHLGWVPQ